MTVKISIFNTQENIFYWIFNFWIPSTDQFISLDGGALIFLLTGSTPSLYK